MTKRLTTGDHVIVRHNKKAGVIIVDDKTDMPYKVKMDETGTKIWYHAGDVMPKPTKTLTVCVSTKPLNHVGNILGGSQYIIENVKSLKQIPRTGVMTGFCGLTNLKGTLVEDMSSYLSETRTTPFNESYKYVYTVIDGNLVAVVDAKFMAESMPEQYEVGCVYKVDEDIYTSVDFPLAKGQIVKLVGKEDEGYEGHFVYRLKHVNSDSGFWTGRDLKMTKL